jgi:hypothetical protein
VIVITARHLAELHLEYLGALATDAGSAARGDRLRRIGADDVVRVAVAEPMLDVKSARPIVARHFAGWIAARPLPSLLSHHLAAKCPVPFRQP